MKKNMTELVFIFDKSGSTALLEFVIITDGEENSSREYSAEKVRSMITLEKESMAETVACYRMTGVVPEAPMDAIRKDMKKRGGRK